MARTLTLLRGLPAAGKSTLVERLRSQRPGLVVLNRDDARFSMFGKYWGLEAFEEKLITDFHMHTTRLVLQKGGDVVIDATNLRLSNAKDFADLAVACGASFDVIDVDTDAKECIRRDAQRQANGQRFVGADVIEGFAKRYPQPWPTVIARTFTWPKCERYTDTLGLPYVIICDLDGTLATISGRGPYDINYENDLPHQHVVNLLRELEMRGHKIVLFSGRKEAGRKGTEEWLLNHVGWHPQGYYKLYMRADNDNRKDDLVKFDLFNEHIRGKYNVTAVFDDRRQVCRMWANLGLPLFMVGHPDHSDF